MPDAGQMTNPWKDRHPSVAHFETMFRWEHLHPNLQVVSRPVGQLAEGMLRCLEDGPELSAGLRKLVEAKDCLVRQAVADLGPSALRMRPDQDKPHE